jgi:kynurenine formamidase
MTRTKLLLVALTAGVAACAGAGAARSPAREVRLPEGARMVDLTHPFDEQTLYWPTSPSGFELEVLSHGKTPGGFFYAANKLSAPEHGGTHLDAPIHFAEGKSTAEAIPLSRLVAPAVVIDITRKASADADALLAPEDIAAFEAAHGPIERGTIVLVRTGWTERWPDRKRYLGDDTPGDASHLHFPGIGAAAARLLVERQIAAAGIDTASIDHGPSKDFQAHQILSAADIPAFENLTALADVPARGALVVALPMKIAGGSGGPLRVIAIVPAN